MSGQRDGAPFTPSDYRGGSGDVRDSYRLPNEDMAEAEYAEQIHREEDAAAQGRKPKLVERFKRWFSARF